MLEPLVASERYKIRSQIAKAVGKRQTASVALCPEMKDMEVEHVLGHKQW